MDKELPCDFYFGDKIHLPIKLMNYKSLAGFKGTLEYIPLISNFYWQKNAIALIKKKYNYYILTGEPFCLSTWYILIAAKFKKKKTILWTHGWYGNESIIKKIIKKIFFKLSSHILLYGDYAKDLMIENGFNENKLTTIYNSLDYETQLNTRRKLKKTLIYQSYFHDNSPVIIFTGRIQKVKRLDLLIEAIYVLKTTENINCNLVIVGDEVEQTNISKVISKYNLSKQIWLYGGCFDENIIGELIYNADLCVSPGNVGLTAIHSLMYGTPVVTHDNFSMQMPEFESIIKNTNGAFFKENNINSLVENIKNWISISANNRENIRNNCYKIIDEKYNPYNQIEILKKVILNDNSK